MLQRWDSSGSDTAEIACEPAHLYFPQFSRKWAGWQASADNNDMHISVAVMETDSADTSLSVATTFTMMCTSLPHQCEHCGRSAVNCHHYHTSVYSNVKTLQFTSLTKHTTVAAIAVTVLSGPLLSQHS